MLLNHKKQDTYQSNAKEMEFQTEVFPSRVKFHEVSVLFRGERRSEVITTHDVTVSLGVHSYISECYKYHNDTVKVNLKNRMSYLLFVDRVNQC